MYRHDVVCLGEARWPDAGVRARDVLARAARDRFVFYWEPPAFASGEPRLALHAVEGGVMVARPHLPHGLPRELADAAHRALIDDLLATQRLAHPILWYRAHEARAFTRHVRARAIVYDCLGRARTDHATDLARQADVVLDEDPAAPLACDAIWARVEAIIARAA